VKTSINDKCKSEAWVLIFFMLYYGWWHWCIFHFAQRDIFPWHTECVVFLSTRLLFLQYPRVTRQFRPLLWRTVSRRYCMKNILLHEQETPPRDITITTHLVTWEPENPLICRCRQTKLRRMKHFYCRYMCNIFIK